MTVGDNFSFRWECHSSQSPRIQTQTLKICLDQRSLLHIALTCAREKNIKSKDLCSVHVINLSRLSKTFILYIIQEILLHEVVMENCSVKGGLEQTPFNQKQTAVEINFLSDSCWGIQPIMHEKGSVALHLSTWEYEKKMYVIHSLCMISDGSYLAAMNTTEQNKKRLKGKSNGLFLSYTFNCFL